MAIDIDLKGTKYFKGGGGGSAGSTTVTSTPPPPSQTSVEVQMARRDTATQAAKKKGINKTVLAGETGGFQPVTGATLGSAGQDVVGQQRKNTVLGGA